MSLLQAVWRCEAVCVKLRRHINLWASCQRLWLQAAVGASSLARSYQAPASASACPQASQFSAGRFSYPVSASRRRTSGRGASGSSSSAAGSSLSCWTSHFLNWEQQAVAALAAALGSPLDVHSRGARCAGLQVIAKVCQVSTQVEVSRSAGLPRLPAMPDPWTAPGLPSAVALLRQFPPGQFHSGSCPELC